MRGLFILICVSVALGAGVACASAEDDPLSPSAQSDTPSTDGGAQPLPKDARSEDAERPAPACSAAGWCATALPDGNLTLRDMWPLADHAFAIAESPTLGVKVLEWSADDSTWQYIDDDTQNEDGFGPQLGRIWAPNENEVYYGISPGFIYYGKRANPSATWSWERARLPDNSHHPAPGEDFVWAPIQTYPTLGVWGTGPDDVYAWYANAIFRRTHVEGQFVWVADHVADDTESPAPGYFDNVLIFGMGGSGKDDVWFVGARDFITWFSCSVVGRKTADGYRRVVDSVVSIFDPQVCLPRDGVLGLGRGWLTDVQSVGPGSVVGLWDRMTLVQIEAGDGGYTADLTPLAPPSVPNRNADPRFNSLWFQQDEAWLSGWGFVVHGGLGVPDGAERADFAISSVSLTGAPLDHPIYRVRGTSKDNIWAVGARYALHKTTP